MRLGKKRNGRVRNRREIESENEGERERKRSKEARGRQRKNAMLYARERGLQEGGKERM